MAAQAACPAEQGAAIASEIGRPLDRAPGPEERSADPAQGEGRGPVVRGSSSFGGSRSGGGGFRGGGGGRRR